MRDSEQAVDLFLQQLPARSGLPPERILLVLDAIRQSVYDPNSAVGESYYARMHDYFVEEATGRGYEIVDLHLAFEADYAVHGEPFEFPVDAHWNKLGHWVVARAIAQSRVFTRAFEEVRLSPRPLKQSGE